MKRLVLVRHAKAVHWGYEDDFSRELTGQGESDAAKVSIHLKSLGIIPGLIISSPALRALQTAMIFADNFSFSEKDIIKKSDLYHGLTTRELLELIHAFPEEQGCIFIVGHNPAMELYSHALCISFDNNMPTSSAVIIDFEVENWSYIKACSGVLYAQISPRALS